MPTALSTNTPPSISHHGLINPNMTPAIIKLPVTPVELKPILFSVGILINLSVCGKHHQLLKQHLMY